MDTEITADELAFFRELIRASSNIVVFSGAGISTESGIPDFRGPNGIWKTNTPIDFSDYLASEDKRRESWRQKLFGKNLMAAAEPNAGHLAVARLVQLGKVSFIITQNVDGLHQKSGVPDDQVIELHGNTSYAVCLQCAKRYELEDIRKTFSQNETLPYCEDCGGIIKTATISFGQAMPETEMEKAQLATMHCDLFIALGSSLVVWPAAGFPRIAKQNGARLAIINNEPTDLDPLCDLVLHHQIGPTLSKVVD